MENYYHFIHETGEHAFVTVSTVNEVVGAWNTVKADKNTFPDN